LRDSSPRACAYCSETLICSSGGSSREGLDLGASFGRFQVARRFGRKLQTPFIGFGKGQSHESLGRSERPADRGAIPVMRTWPPSLAIQNSPALAPVVMRQDQREGFRSRGFPSLSANSEGSRVLPSLFARSTLSGTLARVPPYFPRFFESVPVFARTKVSRAGEWSGCDPDKLFRKASRASLMILLPCFSNTHRFNSGQPGLDLGGLLAHCFLGVRVEGQVVFGQPTGISQRQAHVL